MIHRLDISHRYYNMTFNEAIIRCMLDNTYWGYCFDGNTNTLYCTGAINFWDYINTSNHIRHIFKSDGT